MTQRLAWGDRVRGSSRAFAAVASSASAVLGAVGLCLVLLLLPLHQAPCFCCQEPPEDLPRMCHGLPLRDAPLLVVRPGQVLLDGIRIDGVERIKAERPAAVWPLVDLLTRKRELWSSFHPHKPFPGHVTLQITRDVPAGVVKSVVASCAAAGFGDLDFMGVRFCS